MTGFLLLGVASKGTILTPVNAYLNLGDSNTEESFAAFSEAPTSYLANDSANASNIYDARLSGTITPLIAPTSATVTMTIAAPCVVTDNAHGKAAGTPVVMTNSGGALPTGVTAGNELFVAAPTTNTYKLAATYADAIAGTNLIASSGSQTGTHTATYNCGLQHQVDKYAQSITANIARTSCCGHFEWVKQLRIDQASQRIDFLDVTKGSSRFSDAGAGDNAGRDTNWDASLTDGAYNDLKVRVAAYTALLLAVGKYPVWVGCRISGPANGFVDTTESNAFGTKLTALVAAIRADIIGNSVPIIIDRLGTTSNQPGTATFGTNVTTIRAAQAALVTAEIAAGRTAYLVNTDGGVTSDNSLHWSLGTRVFLNRAAYCKVNNLWFPEDLSEANAPTHRWQPGDIRGAPLGTFSGTALITIPDTVGGFSPTQATSSKRPTLVTAALANGYPTCRGATGDGVDDVLLYGSGAALSPNADWGMFAVISAPATANKYFFCMGGTTANPLLGFGSKGDGSGKLVAQVVDNAGGSSTPVDSGLVAFDGSKHFIAIWKSGSSWTFQVDGTVSSVQTLAPGTTTVNRTSLFAGNSNAGVAAAWMNVTIWDLWTAGVPDSTYRANARAFCQRMWGAP